MFNPKRRILVIKLGALGDFILATGPFAAIRKAHINEQIILLTTAAYAELGSQSPFFDEVWIDERPSRLNLIGIQKLRRKLRGGGFFRVYDLQTSQRSNWYFRLMKGFSRPQWSGIALGCSHPHTNSRRNHMHTVDRQADQLSEIGVTDIPTPDLAWLDAQIDHFNVPNRFALLVPGGAAHRQEKRWPKNKYKKLASTIRDHGITPIVLGGPDEMKLAEEIADDSGGFSIAGKTTFAHLAALSRLAVGAIGNDTGPMHIAAICGCRSVVLFSHGSNPALTAPRGPHVTVLRNENLADLSVYEVAAAFSLR